MMKTYEVTGRYPAMRPKPIGTTVSLLEEQARYHVLEGALKEVVASAEATGKRKGEDK